MAVIVEWLTLNKVRIEALVASAVKCQYPTLQRGIWANPIQLDCQRKLSTTFTVSFTIQIFVHCHICILFLLTTDDFPARLPLGSTPNIKCSSGHIFVPVSFRFMFRSHHEGRKFVLRPIAQPVTSSRWEDVHFCPPCPP